MSGYIYETEIELMPDLKGIDDPIVVSLALELTCSQRSEAPSGMFGPPEFYDPGSGPEFDLDKVRIEFGQDDKGKVIPDLILKPAQFDAMFGKELSDKLFEEAWDAAAETGEF